jgi:beta-glucosidase
MSLAEKAGQMTQVEFGSITPDEVAEFAVGSILSGGGGNPADGSAKGWRTHVESFVEASRGSRLGIPILYGTDAVHGHNNVFDATIFPHNISLGATRDADLVRRVSRAAALETAATGARWSFAPCLAVPQDIRWGRTYEGFSQDVDVVTAFAAASVDGWHGDALALNGVLACAKHFVAEGAMGWGTAGPHRQPWIDWWNDWGSGWQIDQGDVDIDEDELRRTHLPPFAAAVDAGVLTVMAMYGSWHGRRLHSHEYLLTEVLKNELGFSGFVVSDWMAVDQIDEDFATAVAAAINAGVDMVMVPFEYHRFITTVVDVVESGRVPLERIDDAVSRILAVKSRLGLLGGADRCDVALDVVGCDEHRSLAREAVSSSAVALIDRGALPITAGSQLLTAGEALDDVGLSCGGWTISWTGGPGPITDGRTIVDGLRRIVGDHHVSYERDGRFDDERAPVGIVSIHEPPYVEGGGDRDHLSVPDDQVEVVRRMRHLVDELIVIVISGRPMILEAIEDLADAVVACWLPGSEADGVADVLTGQTTFGGTLPVAWPRGDDRRVGDSDLDTSHQVWPIGHHASVPLATTRTGGE